MPTSKPVLWDSQEVAAIVGGQTTCRVPITGISYDSRLVEDGDLFFAIKAADYPNIRGSGGDGHAYVADALKKGAVACVVEHIPAGMQKTDQLIIVPSTRRALQDLAAAARERTGATIIAVTGSVGKTSTRGLLDLAFSSFGQTYSSIKSYNNAMGVPYSMAGLPDGTDYAIFEVGMNYAGEITPLSQQLKPDIAIITSIEYVHVENFENGILGVADAKAEIFAGLAKDGIAILPRDSSQFDRALVHTKAAQIKHIYSFGTHTQADARMIDCLEARNGTRVTATILGEEVSYSVPAGKHQAMNALAVLLAVKAAKGDMAKAVAAIARFEPEEGRGREEKLNIGDPNNPVVLLDESYNASPASMNAAFRVLALIDPGRGGRRVAILGDMLELGSQGPKLHADLALPLRAANIDLVYTCGTLMKNLHDALPANQRGGHKPTSAELAQIVPEVLVPGDVVMVKGSRGSRMDLVVEALRALPAKGTAANTKEATNRHAL